MSEFKVSITDEDIDAALEQARLQPERTHALSAEYVGGKADVVVIHLSTGGRLTIPREELQGLVAAVGCGPLCAAPAGTPLWVEGVDGEVEGKRGGGVGLLSHNSDVLSLSGTI